MADEVDPIGAIADVPEPAGTGSPFWDAALGVPSPEAPPPIDEPVGAVAPVPDFLGQRFMQRAAGLEQLFSSSKFKDGDQHAKVLEISGKLGTPANLVEANLEGFTRAAEIADFDAVSFLRDNPVFADAIFADPEAAPIAFKKPEVGYWQALKFKLRDIEHWFVDAVAAFDQAIKADPELKARLEAHRKAAEDEFALPGEYAALAGQAPAVPSPSSLPTPAEMDEEKAAREKYLNTPRPIVIDPSSELEGLERIFGQWQWTPQGGAEVTLAPPWAKYLGRSWKEQVTRSRLGGERRSLAAERLGRMLADLPPDPALEDKIYEVDKRVVDLKNELVPTDFGASGIETILGEALNLLPSQSVAFGTAGGAGLAAGLVALVATKNPAMAAKAWRWGSTAGAVLATRSLEANNAYLDMVDQGIEDRWALPASEAYGWLAAAVEVEAMGPMLRMFGPVGDAVLRGERKAFAQAMLKDAGLRTILEDAGKRYVKGVYAEAREEAIQDLLQDTATYLARSAQEERFASPDIAGSLDSAAETFIRTGIGTAVMGLGGGVTNVGSQLNHLANLMVRDENIAATTKTQALLSFLRDSSLAKAKPELVSQMIEEETARSGTPVTGLWVTAQRFIRLFQKDGQEGDWETAAKELGGDKLVEDLKVAAATGAKVEIPLADFSAKWAGKPIAEALAADMTVRPYGETLRELVERQAEFREQARALADDWLKGNPPPATVAEQSAIEAMVDAAASAVIKDPEELKQAITLWRAYVHTMAKSWKKTPDEVFRDFALAAEQRSSAEAAVDAPTTQRVAQEDSDAIEASLTAEGREWTRIVNEDGSLTYHSTAPNGTAQRVDTLGKPAQNDGGATPSSTASPASDREAPRPDGAPSSSTLEGIRSQTGAPVSDAGTLNAGETARRLFQTENWQEWFERFRENKLVKKTFTQELIEQLRVGMEHARLIFTRAYEQRIMPTEFMYEFDNDGNVVVDEDGKPVKLNPLRKNEDFDESFDLSTICPRQDLFTSTIHALERRLNRVLSPTQRHLVGVMLQEHGDQPACWYCYGQASRNAFDQTVANDAAVARKYVATMKRTKGKATEAELAVLFSDKAAGYNYTPTGILGQYLAANWKALAKEGVPGDVQLRDMVMGYAPAKLASHQGLAAAAGSHAQAATKANQPKAWAMLQFQFFDKGPDWVERKNARAGLRFNSQTDIRGWHLIDLPQAFAMAQAIGLMGHVYTKERDFLLIFGKTGMKFNLSAAYITKGGKLVLDSRGLPVFDHVFGMAGEDIERFIAEYPQVAGGMLVAHNDLALWAGLEDQRVHQIIPYHKGKVSAPINFFEDARDYTDYQAEIWTRRGTPGKYEIRAPDGKWYKAGTAWTVTLESGENIDIPLGWSMDHSHHNSNEARYFEICNKVGCAPKFALSNKMGNPALVVTKPDGTKTKLVEKGPDGKWVALHPEYMKLVRDVAREPQNQQPLDASKINWQELHRAQEEWIAKGGDNINADPKIVAYVEDRIRRGDWPADKKLPTEADAEKARAKLKKTKQAKALDKEIADLAGIAKAQLAEKPGVPGLLSDSEARLMQMGERLFQAAFHGTGVRGIGKFSVDFIGTGQGAASYGWGLYFAENPEVAENYRRELSRGLDATILKDGKPLSMLDKLELYFQPGSFVQSYGGGRDLVVRFDRFKVPGGEDWKVAVRSVDYLDHVMSGVDGRIREHHTLPSNDELVRVLRRQPGITVQEGQVYKVDLPEKSELLDWDRKFGEMPQGLREKIIAAMRAAGFDPQPEMDTMTGQAIYKDLAEALHGEERGYEPSESEEYQDAQEMASRHLGKFGIPGLMYWDGGSRGKKTGTHNFVIWNDEAVSVMETLYQREQAGGPVVRGWMDKARDGIKRLYRIAVTEHANRSTFIHESSHVFFDMMGTLAEDPAAPQRLKDDYATALKWMGAATRADVTVDMEEKWARSFEAYLATGKAPSLSLVRPFTRFRIWLTRIYGAITGIPGAELDDTITGVFDRMLATDREIENVKQAMGLQQLWRSPEEANMTPEEWRAYLEVMSDSDLKAAERAQIAVAKEQLREIEAWWKDEEANVRKQLDDDFEAQPGWLAYRLLKLGETAGNPALEALKDLDLNEAAVAAALKDAGSAYAYQAQKKLAGKIKKDGVLTPDQLGEPFGMTGTEIMRAILDLPVKEKWVKAETAAAMAAQHGDVVAEKDRLRELVADALHEGPQLHYLMHEYDVLRQRAGQAAGPGAGGVPVTSMHMAAEEIVERTKLLDLSERRALAAERRASEDAFQKVAKGDFAGALVAKQQQILNMLIYRASQDARSEADSFERLLEKQNDDKRRGYLGKADRAFLDLNDRILEALKLRAVPTDPLALKDRKGLKDVLDRLALDGMEPAFDEEVVQRILDNPPAQPMGRTGEPRPAYLNLSVEDMREVWAALKQIKKLASDVVRVQLGDQKIAIEGLNLTIAGEAAASPDRGKQVGAESTQGWWYSTKKAAEELNAHLTNPQLLIERLGPTAYKFLWTRYNKTLQVEADLMRRVFDKVQEAWKKLSEKDQKALARLIDPADLPLPEDVDRSNDSRNVLWLILVAANMGNESNEERLLKGYDWSRDEVVKTLQKYLTHDQMEWVQSLWDLMDHELYPAMAEVYRNVNGVLPNKIEAKPITLTIDGVTKTYRGGYWPARYDPVATRQGKKQIEGPMAKALGTQSVATSMNRSFTKARAEHFSDVINLEWNVFPSHVFDLIHYVATDEFVREAYRVMQTGSFQRTVRHRLGESSNKELDLWLKTVAVGPRVAAAAQELHGMAKVLGFFRSRFTMGVLGASMQTMAGDLPAPLLAITDREVKARYMVPAMLSGATGLGWLQMRKHALAKSPLLRLNRENWRHRLAQELAQPIKTVKSNKAKEALEFAREAAWFGFEAVERLTSTIIWEGAYRQGLDKGLSEELAIEDADQVIEHLYPSHNLAKQAQIVRAKSTAPWLAFYSFFSSRYSQTRRTFHPAFVAWNEAEGIKGTGNALAMSARAAAQTVASILVMNVLSELLSGRGPEEDEKVPEWMLRKSLEGAFMLVPLGGEVSGFLTNQMLPEGKKRQINERAAPMFSAVYAVQKALVKAADGDAETFDRALALGEVAAYGLKLPVSQPKRTIKYLFKGENRSPAGVASGVIYGERDRQPGNVFTIFGGRR